MDDKITIIEGPIPIFEDVNDGWAVGLNEGPYLYDLALTRLRSFNGAALVERCHRTWSKNAAMFLHYKNELGLEEQAPIMAARTMETQNGDLLLLWIRREPEDIEFEFDIGETDDDEDDIFDEDDEGSSDWV